MRRDEKQGFGKRAGRFLLAGVLAVSMVPAVAATAFAVGVNEQGGNDLDLKLANQQWTNSRGEVYTIWDDGYWSLRDDETGTYVWSTVIQGDNSHYGHYDVDITFKVDDGVLTAVDMTSQGTTFGGIWGNVNKTSVVSGYLPTGVENTTAVTAEGDDTLVALSLGGDIKDYDTQNNGGYSIKEIALYQADHEGNVEEYARDADGNIIYDEVYDPDDGDYDLVPRANGVTITSAGESSDEDIASYEPDTQMITVKDSSYNLVKTDYVIGDFFTFEQYTATDDDAAKYDIAQTDYAAEPSGIALKNRDSYTLSVYAIMLQHELGVYMDSGQLSADIDTVSSATKSSWAIQEAIYAALGYYYPVTNKVEYDENIAPTISSEYPDPIFTDVSGSLRMTIDGEKVVHDGASAFQSDNGTYTFEAEDYKDAEGEPSLTIGSIALYKFDDELSGAELFDLGSNNDSTLYKADNGEDVSGTGYLAGWMTKNSGSHGVKGALGSDEVSGDATWEADTNTLIINNTDATHVVVGYSVAKAGTGTYGQVCVAYSLADLLAAGSVNDLIEAMSPTSSADIIAASAAYEELSKNAKLSVDPDNTDKLTAAADKLSSLEFSDVAERNTDNDWYFEAVYDMALLGYINGYWDEDAGAYVKFGVGDSMTRAQLATILWRIAEPEAAASYDETQAVNESTFTDVPDHTYYTAAVKWAQDAGVTTGYVGEDGTQVFNPDGNLQFEEMISMVARYALGSTEAADDYDPSVLSDPRFVDGASVSDWARGAMAWSIDNGLVTGGDNLDGTYTLSPAETVARERGATVLWRAHNESYLS